MVAAREVIDKWYEGEYPAFETDTTTVHGNVLSSDGEPLQGITMVLRSGRESWHAISDRNGTFYIAAKQGAYKLQVFPPGGAISKLGTVAKGGWYPVPMRQWS